MAGALSGAISDDASGGAGYDPNDAATLMPPDEVQQPVGALSQSDGGFSRQQADYANEMRGPSPLQRQSELQAQRDSASRAKAARIQQAMAILQGTKDGQNVNLPLLAWSSAMGLPTKSGNFSESLANAGNAAIPVLQNQRQVDMANAAAMGKLGIDEASVGLENSKSDIDDYWKRIATADRAASNAAITQSRTDTARLREDGLNRRAQIAAGARITVADINSQKGQWTYLGPDPDDPTIGRYMNKSTGSTNEGPPVSPKTSQGQDPARVREAKELIKQKVAPDFGTAYAMVRSGVNDANTFQRLVQAEKAILLKSPASFGLAPAELETMARENVVARRSAAAGSPPPAGAVPGAPAQAPQAPAPQAPALGQPQPQAPQQAPQQQGRAPTPAELDSARKAIEQGADPAAVKRRMIENGINPSGL